VLRVGLVGAGWVSAHHLRSWARVPEASVVAICDPDLGSARRRAAEFRVPSVLRDLDAMLARTELDAVDVATPPHTHGELCLAALRHGKAVLCQKPLAPSHAEAAEIARAARGLGRLMIHENWKHRPHYERMRAWVAGGEIGRLQDVRLETRSSGLLADGAGRFPAIERQPLLAKLPRLMIAEVLVHHLDVLRALAGGGFRVTGAAISRTSPAVTGEDSARLDLESEGAARALVYGTMTDRTSGPGLVDSARVQGDSGTITLAGSRLTLRGRTNATVDLDLDADYRQSYEGAIRGFVEALATGTRFPTEVDDHLAVLALAEDAYAAAGPMRSERVEIRR